MEISNFPKNQHELDLNKWYYGIIIHRDFSTRRGYEIAFGWYKKFKSPPEGSYFSHDNSDGWFIRISFELPRFVGGYFKINRFL